MEIGLWLGIIQMKQKNLTNKRKFIKLFYI